MPHTHKDDQSNRSGQRRSGAVTPPVELVEPDQRRFWIEKYRFNVSRLGLNDQKAREWADRAVRVKMETEREEPKNLELAFSH